MIFDTYDSPATTEMSEPQPETKPNFDGTAQNTLSWLWPGHVYLFAVLFMILGFITILALVLKSKRNKYLVKTIMLCAIIILSVSRFVVLFVDPYLSRGSASIWWIFGYVLLTGIGTTSLTASLAILLYITTISTRITSLHRQTNLGRAVCCITTANFAFFITSDAVTIVSNDKGKIMLTVCQLSFACWGILVSTGFAFLACKLRKNAQATFEQARLNIGMKNEEEKLKRLSVLLGIISVTAAMFFVLRICEAITGLTSEKYSDTWSWWAMQTVLRTIEIINAIVLLLIFRKECNKANRNQRPRATTGTECEKLHSITTWH